ncbi:MAG: hypothetical protein KDA24_15810 [Deltaproteobacteria bacterium]|nr:hypothetical protein [Deltaproteobacteria bacterium]
MTTSRLALGGTLALLLSLLFSTAAVAAPVSLKGKVLGTDGQIETPLASVKVTITALGPTKGKKEAPAKDLIGVAITNANGGYSMTELSSPSLGEDFPLLRNWRYAVHVEAPDHWIYDDEFTVGRKGDDLDFVIKNKDFEVIDDSGGVQEDDRPMGIGGSVRRNT